MDYYALLRPLFFALPPEMAHGVTIKALEQGWVPALSPITDARLGVCCAGLGFDSPIGLAAGFDKNARVIEPIFQQGFSFMEVGTVTPRAQDGNKKPRLFRLKEDEAVINRLGFNNDGADATLSRVAMTGNMRQGILGINIGKNRDTEEALDDYLPMIGAAYDLCDYITVNISSPNTAGLRDLQEGERFGDFIKQVMQERNAQAAYRHYRRPIFLKIAPDMETNTLHALLEQVMLHRVDGVIISNTTVSRPSSLKSRYAGEEGGLSGRPLADKACAMLSEAYRFTESNVPLIGVGGIMSGDDAVARIRSGATLIQVYTGLIYHGLALVQEIKQALLEAVEREGGVSVESLVGIDHT